MRNNSSLKQLRFPLISVMLIAFASIHSCTDFQETPPNKMSVNVNNMVFSVEGNTRQLTVCSGNVWDVASKPDWLSIQSINQSSSIFEWAITFSALANDEYDREGVVVFKSKSGTIDVQVTQEGKKGKFIAVQSVSLSPKELTLTEGENAQLTINIVPSNASIKDVTWESSLTSVATVSSSGNIKAISSGTATITVTTEDGEKIATCVVTVTPTVISVTDVSLDYSSLTITEGDSQTLTATVSPSNASDKSVTWSSSNTSVATVSSAGVVTGMTAGNATITVKTTDGEKIATCAVTVKARTIPVTGVSLDKTSLTMTEGDTQTLTATITPFNATDQSVTWSSSNTLVATVSPLGVVAAKAAGYATITVKTNDGGKTADCSITIRAREENIVFTDQNFKAYCLANYDTNKDGEISTTEALQVTEMKVCTDNIECIDEIVYFKNLRELSVTGSYGKYRDRGTYYGKNSESYGALPDCESGTSIASGLLSKIVLTGLIHLVELDFSCNNSVLSVDISDCKGLVDLTCQYCNLTILDLSNNSSLESLSCSCNQLSSIVLPYNSLKRLSCDLNQLTRLDVSHITTLTDLSCSYNHLTNLDVSKNALLTYLFCDGNQMESLNVGNCYALTRLYCNSNKLTSLDVSNNTALSLLNCRNNRLTSLDVSNNKELETLWCEYNPYLTEIWLKRGQTITNLAYDMRTATIKYRE